MIPLGAIRDRVGRKVDAFTEEWIGWSLPPVERAFAEAKFIADSFDDYCQRCGDSVAPGERTDDGCGTCRTGRELSGGIADGVVRVGPYVEPLRSWIRAIKYQRWAEMGDALGTMLGERVRDSRLVEVERAIVVPMPMPWQRRMYRGVDHAAVLAKAVARTIDAPMMRLLARRMHAPQVSLSASERKRAGARGMRVRQGLFSRIDLAGAHIVLVDDVRTSGSTLKSAARLLNRRKPDRIVCAVVGVSDSAARQQRRAVKMSAESGVR